MTNVQQKLFRSVPPAQIGYQDSVQAPGNTFTFQYEVFPMDTLATRSATVVFTDSVYFQGFTAGMAYEFQINIFESQVGDMIPGTSFEQQIIIEGNIILDWLNTTVSGIANTYSHTIGYIVKTANPVVSISLNIPRPSNTAGQNNVIYSSIVITQLNSVYNPASDCCTQFCGANSGVNVLATPPTCVTCGNSSGLVYNSVTGACQCLTGYYLVVQANTNTQECYPCFAPLCQSCNQTSPTVCNSCVSGAAVNNNSICACLPGYYQAGALCSFCPYQCATCAVASVCTTCSDYTTRDPNNNCVCLAGFYDSGSPICSACSALCQTCNAANNCTSCFVANNRTLSNGQCVCATGFYQIVNPDGSLTCGQCDPTCTACSLQSNLCSNCDPTANRILGYNSLGQQICNCLPGFVDNGNGNCVQSSCTNSPFCSNCQQVLNISTCIQCIAGTNRVLVLPQQTCQCQQGFFELLQICTACSDGCAKCVNATSCQQCVVSATANGNGGCNCPSGAYFVTSPIRYCKSCPTYCTSCQSATNCTACLANFQLNAGSCICPAGRFINNGQCTPCLSGCSNCVNSTSCQVCNLPLLLQAASCVSRCGPGYYQSGYVCTKCGDGCAFCTQANICTYCNSGKLAYNGFCYTNCPDGSVVNSNASTCVSCNSPCATCTQHPSTCTSCLPNCGSLFNLQCVTQCPVGTYSINGTCQYCSYSCATCLGTNTTCTSCPANKVLYNGACYTTCPYIMIGGICTFQCAAGYYKTSINSCVKCNSLCATCNVNPNNCTSCVSGYAVNGTCIQTCPLNFLAGKGVCNPCDPSCSGCLTSATTCINCAQGFYKCGSLCVKTCYPNQYPDGGSNSCITCNSQCKTCSSQQFCTTCANPQAVPVNGVCNDCSYPCGTCGTAPSVCTSCVTGFSLIGSTCIAQCPNGASPVNGVCQCSTGYIYSGQCVSSCPSGFGNVGGQCTACGANCSACSGNSNTCTACNNGYQLNAVTGICQVAPNCQLGQYFSQSSNACSSICPQNTYYFESVCLAACLQGYQDNGVGGCVQSQIQTGCSYPYYLSNGVCVSTCPAQTYSDNTKRICSACSSNCFSCLSNTFCYACNPGYDLQNGICVASTINCPTGQYRYNGVCYTSCPIGTCSQGTYCQRTCPAGSWAYQGGCYRNCPTNYTTNDACVSSCPAGTTLQNGICQSSSRSCSSGQFFNSNSSSCQACQYPCTQCQITGSYCTACSTGLTLNQNLCVSTSNACGTGSYKSSNGNCQSCPAKCAGCVSATSCSSCATGYTFNGFDCVVSLTQLQPITLSVSAISKRGNTVFVTVTLNIIPNGLTSTQKNQFFLVVPNTGDQISYVNQWLDPTNAKNVIVAVNYVTLPTQSAVFLSVNAQILASAYSSIGYTADATSFVSASINAGIPQAPASLVVPATASNSNANQGAGSYIADIIL